MKGNTQHTRVEPMFELDGFQHYTRNEMLDENIDDENFCDWLISAKVGDEYGGSPAVTCVRIS